MKNRLLALFVSIVLLAAAWGGAVNSPQAVSAAQDSVSPGVGAAVRLGPAAAPTPETTLTPPGAGQLARFDEAAGVFSVRYPRDFCQIRQIQGSSDTYGYTFANSAGDSGLAVGFLILSDKALSDGEWGLTIKVLGPETLLKDFGEGFNAEFAEVTRQEGEQGAHTLYWEGEASKDGRFIALHLEESEGVLATIAVAAPDDQWTERRDVFSASLESLAWSPGVVREQIGPTTKSGEGGTATEAVEEIAIEPSPESSETPDAVETPAETETETRGEIDIVESTEVAEPTPTPEGGTTPAENDVVESDQTPVGDGTVDFQDPDGVFSLSYPAEFDNTEGPSMRDGTYVYAVYEGDGSRYLAVTFLSLADKAMPDDQWKQSIGSMVKAAIGNLDKDATEEFRSAGDPGEHWVYVEAESKSAGARAIYYMEEAGGMLAMVLGQVPSAEWSDWEKRFVSAVNSFRWSSDAARQALGGGEAAQPEPTARPKPKATQPPPTSESLDIPAGKGGLVMLNCRSDVVTVDVIPDGVFQELGPKTGNDCHRGEPIFLNPGEHILKASIAGVPSRGESTITVVAGKWLEFTWQ